MAARDSCPPGPAPYHRRAPRHCPTPCLPLSSRVRASAWPTPCWASISSMLPLFERLLHGPASRPCRRSTISVPCFCPAAPMTAVPTLPRASASVPPVPLLLDPLPPKPPSPASTPAIRRASRGMPWTMALRVGAPLVFLLAAPPLSSLTEPRAQLCLAYSMVPSLSGAPSTSDLHPHQLSHRSLTVASSLPHAITTEPALPRRCHLPCLPAVASHRGRVAKGYYGPA